MLQLQNPFVHLQQHVGACRNITHDGHLANGVSSIKISGDRSWEVFSDNNYQGDQMVLQPGDYATNQELMSSEKVVLSFRPVESVQTGSVTEQQDNRKWRRLLRRVLKLVGKR